jgi:hypothetical protein
MCELVFCNSYVADSGGPHTDLRNLGCGLRLDGVNPSLDGVNAVENSALTPWKSGVNAVEISALTPT